MAKNVIELIIAAKDQASKAIDKISGTLKTGLKVAAGAAAVAVATLTATMIKGVKAANVQENAELKLAAALRTAGIATEENYKHLTKYASSLQQTTRYGDEATLSAQALLIQLGNLRGEGLDKATKASADFASALGMSIEQAALLVAKGAEMPSMLSRYGIRVDENIPKGEKFNAVLEQIEKKFGGTAQAMVKNYSGRMAQLSNTVGDTFESFGKLITRNTVVLEAIKEAKGLFEKLGNVINDNREEILEWVKQAMIGMLEAINRSLPAIEWLKDAFYRVLVVVRVFKGDMKGAYEALAEVDKPIEAIEKIQEAIDDLTQKLENTKAQSQDTAKALLDGQEQVVEAWWNTAEAEAEIQENRALMQELAEKRKQEAIKLTEQREQERQQILSAAADLSITMMKAAGMKGKALAIASAIINTARAVTQVLPNLPLAALIGMKGAAEIAIIQAQKMAKGGIITRPTVVLAGEAGPEAIVPLSRGRGAMGGQLVFKGNINMQTADRLADMTDRDLDDLMEKKLLLSLDRLARRGVTVTT